METVNIHINVDDGMPRFPLTFRIPLSCTVRRLKEIIESQEGLGITEQTIFLDDVELKDRLTLGQQNVVDDSFLDLHVNFDEIPSPTHKTSSVSSQHEDCVVPDIDNDEDVFNFDKPNFPTDPRSWEISNVMEWLKWTARMYNIRNIDFDKFRMNGKGLCMLARNGFIYRVPHGGEHLYEDFQIRLREASTSQSHQQTFLSHPHRSYPYLMNLPEVKFSPPQRNFYSAGTLPLSIHPCLAQGQYSPEPRSPFEYNHDPNVFFFKF